jgi:hypothetical protein
LGLIKKNPGEALREYQNSLRAYTKASSGENFASFTPEGY